MENKTNTSKKVLLVISWIAGSVIGFLGLLLLIEAFASGLCLFLIGLLFIPPIYGKIKSIFNIKKDVLFKTITTVSLFVVMVIVMDKEESTDTKPPQENNEAVNERKIAIPEYSIIEKKDVSYRHVEAGLIERLNFRVVVADSVTREQIQAISEKIIGEYDVDAISILYYRNESEINGTFTVAMAEWAPEGDWSKTHLKRGQELKIDFKERPLTQQNNPTEEESKFSEEERRQIYIEWVAAEKRAHKEADEMYPITDTESSQKNSDMWWELMTKYKAEVREKYGISKEDMSEIRTEATIENWPMYE